MVFTRRFFDWTMRSGAIVFISLWTGGDLSVLEARDFLYTFSGANGGVAALSVDPASGSFMEHRVVASGLDHPGKLVITAGSKSVLVASEKEAKLWLLKVRGKHDAAAVKEIPLKEQPRALAAIESKGQVLVAAEKGWFQLVDLGSGDVLQSWNSRESLLPSGHKGEEILDLPGGDAMLITFQMDSETGKHKGNRLLVFDLARFQPRFDLFLPRDLSSTPVPAALQENGPNPELIFVAPLSKSLVLTLDNYGAVALADLEAALAGRWENVVYLPTAADGAWGVSFPDRALPFVQGESEFLLVSHATKEGGFALVDIADRAVTQHFPASAGAEAPVLLKQGTLAATVVSGKSKLQADGQIEGARAPSEQNLYLFDLSPLGRGEKAQLEIVPLDLPLSRIAALDSETGRLILLAGRGADAEWLTYDVTQRQVLHRTKVLGAVERLEGARD